MCWNSDISMNTFIFSILTLIFIYLTNTYSKYKTKEFDNPLIYLFFFQVALIQLIESFLWKNLKNVNINKLLSHIMRYIIILQPYIIILMIQRTNIKYLFLLFYTIFLLFQLIFNINKTQKHFHSTIGINGNLSWEWMIFKGNYNIILFIYILFYILSSLFINNHLITIFLIVSVLLSIIYYFKYKTFGSMWCWYSNLFLLYFLINILIIQPYKEYNNLC